MDELWLMCCGFIDLSIDHFMTIQKRLLLEQIERLKASHIGRKVMHGAAPQSVDEFRRLVPLTSYADYCPELQERREYALPAPPARWIRTSGYSGTYDIKWVPWSRRFEAEMEKVLLACVFLSGSRCRGDIRHAREHMKVLYTLGGAEYGTGAMGELLRRSLGFEFLPADREGLSFTEKIEEGLAEALYRGLDGFGGLPSVLVTVAERMQQRRTMDPGFLLKHPAALLRLARGLVRSRLAHRPLLPRDLWDVKAIIGGGTDSAVFARKVEEMWGRRPLELYAGSEGGVCAVQTWDGGGLTFVPNLNFLEFIPEEEHSRWRLDHSYRPQTVLLDEVEPNRNYEIVITNFHGGALTRFRVGDMVRIISLHNRASRIGLPQMVFHGRADYLIDIAGLGRLTERIIWEALENTGVPYTDWTARKEVADGRALLHLYVEPGEAALRESGLAEAIGRELDRLDGRYHHNPYQIYGGGNGAGPGLVEVTLLPAGAFAEYTARQQADGADLGHLKPRHINPEDSVIASLLSSPPAGGSQAGVPTSRPLPGAGRPPAAGEVVQ